MEKNLLYNNADYNVLFQEQGGTRTAAAQNQAFTDTWELESPPLPFGEAE